MAKAGNALQRRMTTVVWVVTVMVAGVTLTVASPAAAAPLPQAGNILVSTNETVREYTPAGSLVRTIPVPYPTGPHPVTESARDLVMDERGRLHVYNGTFDPFLSTFDFPSEQWTHDTHPGWSTVNNLSYGGIGVLGRHVFVTDMTTFGSAEDPLKGIVRFDVLDGSSVRFADTTEPIDLTVGLDGLLYALAYDEWTVHVYDPVSLAPVRTFTLGAAVRGIAVDASGQVFGVSWDGPIYRYSSSGAVTGSVPSGTYNLSDIDVSASGQLVIGGRFGDVVLATTALVLLTSFTAGGDDAFVTFAGVPGGSAPSCPADTPTIVGTPGPDRLVGTSGRDVIHGLGGDDAIVGFGGDDILCGGDGRDSITGDAGADQLFGDAGDDRLSGGEGNDLVVGGTGRDLLSGDGGADVVDSRDGAVGDIASGGSGAPDVCRVDTGDSASGCES